MFSNSMFGIEKSVTNGTMCLFSVTSEETAFLLGTCYFRAGRVNEAHYLLHNLALTLPQARFLLAKCSFELKL